MALNIAYSMIRRAHPPQRPVPGLIHCFRQCEIVGSQILLYGAQRCGAEKSLKSDHGDTDQYKALYRGHVKVMVNGERIRSLDHVLSFLFLSFFSSVRCPSSL